MQYMIWVWLGVIVVSLIIEFCSLGMTSIWFAVGGLASLILAACKVDILWQVITFILVSLLFLLCLRKLTLKFLYKNKKEKTNSDALIGVESTLIDEIGFDKVGSVKVNGVVWSCVGKNPEDVISSGTKVVIQQISGNKLIVEKIEKEN